MNFSDSLAQEQRQQERLLQPSAVRLKGCLVRCVTLVDSLTGVVRSRANRSQHAKTRPSLNHHLCYSTVNTTESRGSSKQSLGNKPRSQRVVFDLISRGATIMPVSHSASRKRSANKTVSPSGSSANKYPCQALPASSGNDADSLGTPNVNVAPDKESGHSSFCPKSSNMTKRTFESWGSHHKIPAGSILDSFPLVPLTCNCAAIRRHAFKIQNATSEEISCIDLAFRIGWPQAEQLASKLHLQPQRSWQELQRAVSCKHEV